MICVSIDMDATGEKIQELISTSDYTIKEIMDATGRTKATVYNWKAGRKLPTIDNIVVLSELFGVGLDDIIMRKRVEGGNHGIRKDT